ncbi:GerMN domain-containing protein, partial [bacterium]|nr:GerMN domain-containing protein [bacterium]
SRDISDDAGRIHQIARELGNPPGSGLMETPLLGGAPRGLYLLSGIVYIDLNREFLQAPNQSPAMERLAIYSIVNSFMLNLPSLKGVQIMIDGQVVRSAWGWMDISSPLGPDLSLVR